MLARGQAAPQRVGYAMFTHGIWWTYVALGALYLSCSTYSQDGREWALFWLEDEIALVHPRTREPYKWEWEVYISYPELYGGSKRTADDERPAGHGPANLQLHLPR